MEKLVIAIHDYQHGGVGMLIRCSQIDELRVKLGPSWEVLDQNVEEHPFYSFALENGYEIQQYPNASGLLKKMINLNRKGSS